MHLWQECHRSEAVCVLIIVSHEQCPMPALMPSSPQVPYPTQSISPPATKPSSCCSDFNTLLRPTTAPIFPSLPKWLHCSVSTYWLLDRTVRNRKEEQQRERIGETRMMMRKRMKSQTLTLKPIIPLDSQMYRPIDLLYSLKVGGRREYQCHSTNDLRLRD